MTWIAFALSFVCQARGTALVPLRVYVGEVSREVLILEGDAEGWRRLVTAYGRAESLKRAPTDLLLAGLRCHLGPVRALRAFPSRATLTYELVPDGSTRFTRAILKKTGRFKLTSWSELELSLESGAVFRAGLGESQAGHLDRADGRSERFLPVVFDAGAVAKLLTPTGCEAAVGATTPGSTSPSVLPGSRGARSF